MNPYVHLSPSEMHTFTAGLAGNMGMVGPIYPEPTPSTGAVLEVPAFLTKQVPAWSLLVAGGFAALITYGLCHRK
jgi:hypothetical protein